MFPFIVLTIAHRSGEPVDVHISLAYIVYFSEMNDGSTRVQTLTRTIYVQEDPERVRELIVEAKSLAVEQAAEAGTAAGKRFAAELVDEREREARG